MTSYPQLPRINSYVLQIRIFLKRVIPQQFLFSSRYNDQYFTPFADHLGEKDIHFREV